MWRIEKKLAAGGMGEVFLARTPEGQRVAVKRTPSTQEVGVLVKLRHPSIVSILGYAARSDEIFGEDRGPCYWMEYVEGQDVLSASRKAERNTIVLWLTQALEALQYLHSQGILHGDLSPGNILVDAAGRLKLVDFGVAGFAEGESVGGAATLPYMAPEKIEGQALPAGDLFSLGTIFYEALAGIHPRAGGKSFRQIVETDPKPIDSSLIARVIDRMIRVEPSERFSQASQVLEALRESRLGSAPAATDYHAAKMFGADEYFAAIEKRLRETKARLGVVCVHGTTGVGKSRFLREVSFLCALKGIKARLFPSLEGRSCEDLGFLLEFKDATPEGELIVLEWSDDGLTAEHARLFRGVLSWPGALNVALKNLSQKDTLAFLMGAFGAEAAEEAVDPLFSQTGGNPLLLHEVARCLLERRAEEGRPFSKKWLGEFANLKSLDGFLVHRLSSLPGPETEVLQLLAVARYPADVGESSPLLAPLLAKELIVPGKIAGTYRLALPSLGGAALQSLSNAEIGDLHRKWFGILKDRPDDDLQKLHHALELREEGVVRNGARKAAEQLAGEGQKEEALGILRQAVSVVSDRDEKSRLLRAKINLLNDMGRFGAALEACETWFGLAAQDEPSSLRAVKYWFITGLNHQNLGHHQEAEARLKRCLETGDPADSAHRPLLVRAYSRLGAHELTQGRAKEAEVYLQAGLNLADANGRRRAEICRNMAEALSLEGDWAGARSLFEEAIRNYQEDRYDEGEFSTYLQEGNLRLAKDDFAAAGDAYEKAEEVAIRRCDEAQRARAESNRGLLAYKKGDWAAALRFLERSHEIFQLIGKPGETVRNLEHLARIDAELGRFADAAARIQEIRGMSEEAPEAPLAAQEAGVFLKKMKNGDGPVDASRLREIFTKLPVELQVTFAQRGDFEKSGLKTTSGPRAAGLNQETEGLVGLLEDLADVNRELLEENDMQRLLKRLLDRALELAQAENGFLVLKSDVPKGPLPGFEIVAARNISKKALETEEYLPSLTAIKRAMQSGLPFVTDNAVEDPLFRNAKSVHLQKLKSILALPVVGTDGILGVFYLDHRLAKGLFEGATLAALKAFAGVAALALQKGRMIEELQAANASLSEEVGVKTSQMGLMQRELKKSRQVLKNEYGDIIGRSPKMLEVLSLVDRITDARIPVWIYGESGTGKESIARALHFNSPRAAKPFVTENCSALPESLLESELFGHKKGAFTNAVTDKQGILAYADGGTIFLDEIADMSLGLQAKLLRFLQEGEVRPVGSNQVSKVDVRVVSASNRYLADLVKQKKFREDLYFRLNGVTVALPALRERIEDVPLLAHHFLEKAALREKKPRCSISQEAMGLLMAYDWPGNIRELQNALETALLFTEKNTIVPASFHFKPSLVGQYVLPKPPQAPAAQSQAIPSELGRILRALRDEGFHRANAARALGMSRRNFYTKLEKFGVPRDFKSLKEYVAKYVG